MMTGKSRAEIPMEWQKQVGPMTLRVKIGTDILIAKGDIIELQISDVAGPFIVSMVRELDLPETRSSHLLANPDA